MCVVVVDGLVPRDLLESHPELRLLMGQMVTNWDFAEPQPKPLFWLHARIEEIAAELADAHPFPRRLLRNPGAADWCTDHDSVFGRESVTSARLWTWNLYEMAQEWARDMLDEYPLSPDFEFGGWTSTEDGRVFRRAVEHMRHGRVLRDPNTDLVMMSGKTCAQIRDAELALGLARGTAAYLARRYPEVSKVSAILRRDAERQKVSEPTAADWWYLAILRAMYESGSLAMIRG